MKRRIFELWEQFYYLLILRGEYLKIKRRSYYVAREKFNITSRRIFFWSIAGIVIILGILLGYNYPLIGFSDYVDPSGNFQRGKTFWDWIELLGIPLILAWLASRFTNIQKEKEIAIAQIEKREYALQNYLDYMTRVLVEKDITTQETSELAQRLIRARTFATIEMLGGTQKGYVLRFLIESGLIGEKQPFLPMDGANLSGIELFPGLYKNLNLEGANLDGAKLAYCHFQDAHMNSITMMNAQLEGADLSSAKLQYALMSRSDLYNATLSRASLVKARLQDSNLEKANLVETILDRADLRGANLQEVYGIKVNLSSANLIFSNLRNANLEGGNLSRANFHGANLRNANLSNTDLSESNITEKQLKTTKSFQGAILPLNIKLSKRR